MLAIKKIMPVEKRRVENGTFFRDCFVLAEHQMEESKDSFLNHSHFA